MTRLTLDVVGAGGGALIDRTLVRIIDSMADLTPAFEAMASEFARLEGKQFESQGAEGSGKWKELSPGYARWKSARYPGKPILERTGALVNSLSKVPLGVQHIGIREMEIGTAQTYAHWHQTGGRHLPKRPPIALSEEGKRSFTKILQRWLITGAV